MGVALKPLAAATSQRMMFYCSGCCEHRCTSADGWWPLHGDATPLLLMTVSAAVGGRRRISCARASGCD